VVVMLPIGIYDGVLFATPEELEWVKFGEWKVATKTDSTRFTHDYPAVFRDSKPFTRLIYNVELRQFKYKFDDHDVHYRNHSRISINVPRAIIAAVVLAIFWMIGWVLWSRLMRRMLGTPRKQG